MGQKKGFDALIAELEKFSPGQPLKKFITHIRFPNFKNLQPGTRVSFEFPVTALVGANGSGKTSVLHALYGAPLRKSTSDFWFSTAVDPIEDGNDNPSRFIYGHWLQNLRKVVETRKARYRKFRKVADRKIPDPDYWEPTKTTPGDAMKPMPTGDNRPLPAGRDKDRWNPAKLKVLYLNFKTELGAFDRFFNFGVNKKTKLLLTKQDRLRKGAQRLKVALETKKTYGNQKIFRRLKLSEQELAICARIVGKKYSSAQITEHNFFPGARGNTVKFRTSPRTALADKSIEQTQNVGYTEAFAGSGEIAIVDLVSKVMRAERNTLILLDEPELSLHRARAAA